MTPELLTTAQAAAELGVSRSRIHQLIRTRRLPAQRLGRDYFIDIKDLDAIRIRPTGRPLKPSHH